jgi:hypothetical protein
MTIEFALAEDRNLLSTSLAVNGRCVFDAKLSEVPPVTVRQARAREDELLDHATYFARRSPSTWRDPVAWLDDYIASREEKIIDRVTEIRKILRMIEGHTRNASIAKRVRSRARK